jgi:hypothetical protein
MRKGQLTNLLERAYMGYSGLWLLTQAWGEGGKGGSAFSDGTANMHDIAGGLWQPDAQQLAALRTAIDRRSQRLKQVLRGANLRKEFLGGIADVEKTVVKKFVEENKESALKTKPKVS